MTEIRKILEVPRATNLQFLPKNFGQTCSMYYIEVYFCQQSEFGVFVNASNVYFKFQRLIQQTRIMKFVSVELVVNVLYVLLLHFLSHMVQGNEILILTFFIFVILVFAFFFRVSPSDTAAQAATGTSCTTDFIAVSSIINFTKFKKLGSSKLFWLMGSN